MEEPGCLYPRVATSLHMPGLRVAKRVALELNLLTVGVGLTPVYIFTTTRREVVKFSSYPFEYSHLVVKM